MSRVLEPPETWLPSERLVTMIRNTPPRQKRLASGLHNQRLHCSITLSGLSEVGSIDAVYSEGR
ncbi:hypothetical protein Halru_0762 [Halovivax ruber XH-70]|uniref:Uncharacterized protein n=1 Tax=Halovivax ruber (strain DSM 18193 / JCM 13892 / XH-70) TaxID=797302 RepID=L0I998_HALRX|nr:hypothetical protein Halru_0762 [Halovivax ruber XH-70]